jgi:phosphoglucosamine mutase
MGRLFGTDGVRGIANSELTCELAMSIGRAAAMVLTDSGHRHPKVLIGKDTRLSSDMLEAAMTAGLCSVGANVVRLGVVSTPAVAFLVGKYKADAGVMLTASHNPCEFNGIKIFSGDGYKLPDALEEQIESIVLDHAQEPVCPTGGAVGSVSDAPNTVRDYVDHIKCTVPFALTGMKIAIDCANGSASRTAELLFSELGAECHMLSDHPNGINVNDACGSTHMENLMRFVGENHLDAGVAFDGDADRCLAVDENGRLVDGDFLMAICAADLKSRGKLAKNTVVGTIMTNMGFNRFCMDDGIKFEATKVGDRYVLEEMLLEGYNFGGEQSGHIIFHDFATTGDGQLTAAQLLSILKRREARLSSLATLMTRYPQVLLNVEVKLDGKLRFYTDPQVKESVEAAKKQLGSRGRVVVRPSGTEPLLRVMVEGENEEEIAQIANSIADVLRDRLA